MQPVHLSRRLGRPNRLHHDAAATCARRPVQLRPRRDTMDGGPGIGKTRLAQAFAEAAVEGCRPY